MTLHRWRTALVIGVVVTVLVFLVRTLRGGPVPAFEAPAEPDWVGPAAATTDAGPVGDPPDG